MATSISTQGAFPAPGSKPVPFQYELKDSQYDDILARVRLYRPSQNLEDGTNHDWREGPPSESMAALATYWKDEYKWADKLEAINKKFSHYAVTIDGGKEYDHPVPLHFVHERSKDESAIPLLFLHGWPSSHDEWSKVIKPLTTPSHGESSFHVVAPDMPGTGFSPSATHSGMSPQEMGQIFNKLMGSLGYEKYVVVSTDLGWLVGMWMTHHLSEKIIGHMTDFFVVQPSQADIQKLSTGQATKEEGDYASAIQTWFMNHMAYSTIQSQAPLTLGQALVDTPVGYTGWIWHLRHAVSDGYEYKFDELITGTMMLLLQGAYGNLRTYKDFMKPGAMDFPKTSIPTGVSQWGYANGPYPELAKAPLVPREWIERSVNLTYFATHEFGGHFPAMTQPELFVHDLREFLDGLHRA